MVLQGNAIIYHPTEIIQTHVVTRLNKDIKTRPETTNLSFPFPHTCGRPRPAGPGKWGSFGCTNMDDDMDEFDDGNDDDYMSIPMPTPTPKGAGAIG